MKRNYAIAMALMAAGGVLLLFAGPSAMGYVALAGIAAVVATRSWGRVVIAAVISIAFAGTAAVAVVQGAWISAIAAVIVLAGSGWAAGQGRRWPAMGSRYERAPGASSDLWEAQDRGTDPTDDLVE